MVGPDISLVIARALSAEVVMVVAAAVVVVDATIVVRLVMWHVAAPIIREMEQVISSVTGTAVDVFLDVSV